MGYEVFERSTIRVEEPSVSIGSGTLRLNAAASRRMQQAGTKVVLLLWDRAARKIALKAASKPDQNTYALSFSRRSSASIRAKSFLAHIGWIAPKRPTLLAVWNERERMLEVALPARCIDPKQ